MKWSWKIGTFAGIDVFMHATFLLIIGWVGLTYWQQTGTAGWHVGRYTIHTDPVRLCRAA